MTSILKRWITNNITINNTSHGLHHPYCGVLGMFAFRLGIIHSQKYVQNQTISYFDTQPTSIYTITILILSRFHHHKTRIKTRTRTWDIILFNFFTNILKIFLVWASIITDLLEDLLLFNIRNQKKETMTTVIISSSNSYKTKGDNKIQKKE